MAKIHNNFGMRDGLHSQCATQKESRDQNKQMIAVGFISDTKDLLERSMCNCQHDSGVGFELSETLPLSPALCGKDLTSGQTHV